MSWDDLKAWDTTDELINVKKDTLDSGVEDLEDKKMKLYVEKTFQVIQQIKEIGLPKKNEQLRLVTFRSFNAVAFLSYIAELEEIEEILLVVYSINAEAAAIIEKMVSEGKIKKAIVLMSNLRNKAHRAKEQITRDSFVNNPNIDLFFASCHSKVMQIKTKCGNHYAIEGSGNLSFNSRVEQYVIDNDEKLYNFTKDWMLEIKTFLKDKKELILT